MQKSETTPAAKQNLNRRASIAAPIAVNDDEEIGESVTAKAAAAWGGFMGKMKSYAAPVAEPKKEEESADSEEEGKFDLPSGDAKLEVPAAGDDKPRDSFAGADDAIEDDEGGATVPKLGGLEVAGKNLIPEPIKVEEQESKTIEAADALELTPGTSYYGELL